MSSSKNNQSQLHMYRNRLNDFFAHTINAVNAVSKDRVFGYTRGNKVELSHMQELKRIMLSLNDGDDIVHLKHFLTRIKERNFVFAESFLTNLIADIKIDATTLSYQKFMLVLNIFYSLPIFRKGESNNSDHFKNSQDQYGFIKIDLPNHLTSLMKLIHMKIDEKFKNYK
jgi:hypothetical protein